MSAEPINIFSWKIDPRGVVHVLRSIVPQVEVTGPEDDWQRVLVPSPKRLFKKRGFLAFTHDRQYYDGPDWPRQRMGMQGYFSRFPDVDRKDEILKLIGVFRFELATEFEPDLSFDSGDPRLEYLFAVARHLDGVFFSPSSLRDAAGRVLIDAGGASDPAAVIPALPPVRVAQATGEEPPSAEPAEEEPEPEPPMPERVARRALALTAVTGRALLEQQEPSAEVEATRQRLLAINWLVWGGKVYSETDTST